MRCLECGAETAELAQVCASCGAPVAPQGSVSADQAEDGSGDSIAPRPWEYPQQTAGQPPGPSSRRNVLVLAGLGFVLLVAVVVLVASVTAIITRLSTSTSSRPSPRSASSPRSAPSSPSTQQLSAEQLQPGDCLTGSDLSLDTNNPWPDLVTVVPCTQQHIAEVFFSGNAWPQSRVFPGQNAVDSQADYRCRAAFTAYDGTSNDNSAFSYDYVDPTGTDDWASGDRSLLCVAFETTPQYPGGAPVNYSIKGSQQ